MALAAPCPAPDAAVLPDGELARRYAMGGDPAAREAAFRALVERHGAMVLAACRRVLRDPAEADDAAQAVFLVLARKAHALVEHPTLGGWLHRVASHVAWRLRDAERARDRREHAVGVRPDAADPALARFELREAIDVALDRLPARYRAPLVLHYLEGLSQDEVARALKLKAGTLASLLSRGRALLRDRLVRQGVAASVAATATAAAAFAPASAAEPVFVACATHTARLVAVAGTAETAAAAKVVALSATTLRAMSMLKLKIAATAVAAVLLVTSGVGLGLAAHGEETPPAPAAAPEAKPEDAILAPVKALRANDANALMKCWPDAKQKDATDGWAKNGIGGGNPWQDRMIDQVLANATSDTGADQISQFVGPFVGRFIKDRKPEETLGQVARGLLADGLESDQVKALKPLGAAMAQWQDEAQLDDADKTKQLTAHLIAALKALDVKDSAALKALDLTTVLTRSNGAMAELKQALAAFDIQVDAFLDSIKVTKTEGTGDNRTLTVAYTAFDTPLTIPVKVTLKDGRWFIAGDSPLTKWLDQRPPRFGGPGGRNGQGGPGGRRRGQNGGNGGNGANGAPADPNAPPPATPPKTESNF